MGLEEKKQSYLARVAGGLIAFAILGAVILTVASYYLSSVFENALPH